MKKIRKDLKGIIFLFDNDATLIRQWCAHEAGVIALYGALRTLIALSFQSRDSVTQKWKLLDELYLAFLRVDYHVEKPGTVGTLLCGLGLPAGKGSVIERLGGVDSLAQVLRKHFHDTCNAHRTPFEGVREMLKELRARGARLAVYSGAPFTSTVERLTNAGLLGYFELVAGWEGLGSTSEARRDAARKLLKDKSIAALEIPHPHIKWAEGPGTDPSQAIHAIRKRFGVHQRRFVVVGDSSEYDLNPPARAGVELRALVRVPQARAPHAAQCLFEGIGHFYSEHPLDSTHTPFDDYAKLPDLIAQYALSLKSSS